MKKLVIAVLIVVMTMGPILPAKAVYTQEIDYPVLLMQSAGEYDYTGSKIAYIEEGWDHPLFYSIGILDLMFSGGNFWLQKDQRIVAEKTELAPGCQLLQLNGGTWFGVKYQVLCLRRQ